MNAPLPDWMPLALFVAFALALGGACVIAWIEQRRTRNRVTWGPDERR